MDRNEKAARALCAVLVLVIVGCCVVAAVRDSNWVYFNQGLATAAAMSVPFLLEAGRRLRVPPITKTVMFVFIFCGMFLGSVNELYYRFFWWDSTLHFLSGPAAGLAAYSIVLASRRRPDGSAGISHAVSLLLIFCFIMTIGAVWEIVEYRTGYLPGDEHARATRTAAGCFDTMTDILLNTLGAAVFTWIAHHGPGGCDADRLAIRQGRSARAARPIRRTGQLRVAQEATRTCRTDGRRPDCSATVPCPGFFSADDPCLPSVSSSGPRPAAAEPRG